MHCIEQQLHALQGQGLTHKTRSRRIDMRRTRAPAFARRRYAGFANWLHITALPPCLYFRTCPPPT